MDDAENLRILRDMAMGRDVSAGDRVMAANWAVREIEKMTACEEQEKPEGVELTDAEIDEIWARQAMSDTFDCVHLLRDAIAADRARRGGVEAEPAAKAIHYPTCWDTAAYPTIGDALAAVYHHFKCSECAPPAVPAEWREVVEELCDTLGECGMTERARAILAGTKQSGGCV